jgi:hypothetical protein
MHSYAFLHDEIAVEDANRVRQKMDFHLMSLLILVFPLQCIDKVMLDIAKILIPNLGPTKNLQRFSSDTFVF